MNAREKGTFEEILSRSCFHFSVFPEVDEIEDSCHTAIIKPTDFHEAVQYSKWKVAIEEEIRMIEKNKTWELVEKLSDKTLELSGSTTSRLIRMSYFKV